MNTRTRFMAIAIGTAIAVFMAVAHARVAVHARPRGYESNAPHGGE